MRNHVECVAREWEAEGARARASSVAAAGAPPFEDVRQLVLCTIAEHDEHASGFVTVSGLQRALIEQLSFPLDAAEVATLARACPVGGADGRNCRYAALGPLFDLDDDSASDAPLLDMTARCLVADRSTDGPDEPWLADAPCWALDDASALRAREDAAAFVTSSGAAPVPFIVNGFG